MPQSKRSLMPQSENKRSLMPRFKETTNRSRCATTQSLVVKWSDAESTMKGKTTHLELR